MQTQKQDIRYPKPGYPAYNIPILFPGDLDPIEMVFSLHHPVAQGHFLRKPDDDSGQWYQVFAVLQPAIRKGSRSPRVIPTYLVRESPGPDFQ